MGYYNVVKPCVVGSLHYVRPTTQPIEVDDDVAAPLVESGCLEPYLPGHGYREHVHAALSDLPPSPPAAPEDMVNVPGISDAAVEAGAQLHEAGEAFTEAESSSAPRRPRGARRKG